MNRIVYGNRCRCSGNCTHSYFITLLNEEGVEVASWWRSGGMLADEYAPSEEVYEKELQAAIAPAEPAQCRCPNGPEYFYPPENGACHYCGAE